MRPIAILLLAAAVGACSTTRDTQPPRTATEQLLLSSAADRAARQLTLRIPAGKKVYVEDQYMEGYDSKYAVGAIRDRLLNQGMRLINSRLDADIIVEARLGALSIDEHRQLFGIPDTELPVPLAGQLKTPEIALFKRHQWKGIAKMAVTAYDAKSGAFIGSSGPRYGASHKTDWVFLLFISRTTDDLRSEKDAFRPHDRRWWDP
ncbi:MAG: hypothetical protein RBS99_17030 [Rhodospirillales bacterium]|jgi:hypothetical protein|nr:hypothetical protein [Rhodospirillales bacterium]